MVDIFGFVPADTSIDLIIGIQLRDVLATRPGQPPHRFGVGDSFARVLCYGAIFWKMDSRKTTQTAKGRLHD